MYYKHMIFYFELGYCVSTITNFNPQNEVKEKRRFRTSSILHREIAIIFIIW